MAAQIVVGYAPTAQSKCKGKCAEKIEKGFLRVGTPVMIMVNESITWRHIPCFTEKQIANQQGRAANEIGGYQELKPEHRVIVDEMMKGKFTDEPDEWRKLNPDQIVAKLQGKPIPAATPAAAAPKKKAKKADAGADETAAAKAGKKKDKKDDKDKKTKKDKKEKDKKEKKAKK